MNRISASVKSPLSYNKIPPLFVKASKHYRECGLELSFLLNQHDFPSRAFCSCEFRILSKTRNANERERTKTQRKRRA